MRTAMKLTGWIVAVAVLAAGIVGCNNKTPSSPPTSSNTTAQANDAVDAAEPVVQVAAETPAEAVGSFLKALQTGDDKVATAMLTTKARQETKAHDLVVEPPGAPNAKYTVGEVQHPDDNPKIAYVSCVWSETYDNGEEEAYEVVWILRHEEPGWRVAGMATQLAESEEPVFLDFEDLTAMENTVQQAESATPPAAKAQQAQQPQSAGPIR